MEKEINNFIDDRINHHEMKKNEELEIATLNFTQTIGDLQNKLSKDNIKLLNKIENSVDIMTGEISKSMYKYGFGDAIKFLKGWCNDEWK